MKQVINETTIKFWSRSANEGFARVTVAAFIAQLDPTVEEVSDVKTAISEAVTNAIIHGYECRPGIVTIKLKLFQDGVEISVSDKGAGIEDVDLARKPLYTSKPDLERSGMGFTVMESFMDKMRVSSKPRKGTTVRMFKNFKSIHRRFH